MRKTVLRIIRGLNLLSFPWKNIDFLEIFMGEFFMMTAQGSSTICVFLAYLSHLLIVSYCDRLVFFVSRPSSSVVVRHQQLLKRTYPPELLARF